MTATMKVWAEQHIVGTMCRGATGMIGFRYEREWLDGAGFAVSQSMPLQMEDFAPEEGVAHRFFANLLPEGLVRDRIVRDLKLPNTDFDLLKAIGGECAGALSILPEDRKPSLDREYRPLTVDDITNLVRSRGDFRAANLGHPVPRLSLAGAQDKCAVLVRGDALFLPQGEAPSSHILKFESVHYKNLIVYEAYTMQLAAAVGLPLVNVKLRTDKKHRFIQTSRYDRLVDHQGNVHRLHQEDFCQALGYGHENKYEEYGGPSFAACYHLIREVSTEPAIDAQHLLRWQIFNVLAGNSDGHAKNLSLLYLPDGAIRLAPIYDLVCTRAIARIDHHLAMFIGNERDPGQVTSARWEDLAHACDVRPAFVKGMVRESATTLMQKMGDVRSAFEDHNGSFPALQRVERVVSKQCENALG